MDFKIQPNPGQARDEGYGGALSCSEKSKSGRPIWPATTQLAMLEACEGKWKIDWKPGNMPRLPLTWDAWSKAAYEGNSSGDNGYFSPERVRERKEKEDKERAGKEAARKAELEAARQEGQAEAEEAKALARTQATELANLRSVQAAEAEAAAKAKLELQQVTKTMQDLAVASEEILCIVCLDQPKTQMFEPCRHVCVCEACSASVGKLCPVCRTEIVTKTKLFM